MRCAQICLGVLSLTLTLFIDPSTSLSIEPVTKLLTSVVTECIMSNGDAIPIGETWSKDCELCTCTESYGKTCTVVNCMMPNCENPVTPPGECCPVCEELVTCTMEDGTLIPENGTWEDGCQLCACTKEGKVCTMIECMEPQCENPVTKPGECCPVCEEVTTCTMEDGTLIPENGTWEDGCQLCACTKEGKVCTMIECMEPQCDNTVTPPGECCPVCEEITCTMEDGTNITETGYWQDGCKLCACTTEGKVCTMIECIEPQCENPVTKPGECCPVCKEITCTMEDGTRIPENGTWKDGCQTCICTNEGKMCADILCAKLLCENPVKKPGDCCHLCPTIDYIKQSIRDEKEELKEAKADLEEAKETIKKSQDKIKELYKDLKTLKNEQKN